VIPVSIVTGFLGSGKTTLISRILRDPAFRRTAVIVNEFGDVALDHDLIASSDDAVLTLTTGCLCCAVQTDLARTLTDLHERRAAGAADYDRVLIETSGLSDPAPMLQTLMTDRFVAGTHVVSTVVTVVDAVHGAPTLDEYAEARNQVAMADRLLLSKTDLQAPSDRLLAKLRTLHPGDLGMTTTQADPALLFGGPRVADIPARLAGIRHRQGHGEIETFTVIRERTLPALALTLLLQAIAEHLGSRLLRMKGLVAIEELPGRPAVIHGVRHVVSQPDFLDRWPSPDERTRIVFITRDVPPHFVSRLLDVIEEEVREAIALAPEPSSG
jgi:G3E family GTPase